MNKGLIAKFYKHKCSPCSVLWWAFVTSVRVISFV